MKIKHVYGNVLKLDIPLTIKIRTLEEGVPTEREEPFYPDESKGCAVIFDSNYNRRIQYDATVSGNVAHIEDDGVIGIGTYKVTVKCYDEYGNPYRYMVRDIIEICDATIDAGIEAGVEFDAETYTLEGAVFVSYGGGSYEQVQADWTEYDTNSKAYIKNKPNLTQYATKEELSEVEGEIPTLPDHIVTDENYVHTDNNYTDEEKQKLAGLSNYDDTQVRQLITQTNANFANYYTKQESYSKTETDNLLDEKQDSIEDLDDIRQGAELGSTALQSFTESDPTVPQWAKQPNKPSYTAQEVGALPADTQLFDGDYNSLSNKPDLSGFITASVDNLVNYYLKSETYTKAEVQTLINAIKQFTYQAVTVLPEASASAMNIIYLVPSADPQTQNVKDEYITIDNGQEAQTRYTWEQIGSTAIDLSGYYTSAQTDAAITAALNTALAAYSTTQQMQTAITTALADYTTTADLTTLLGGKQDTISDLSTIRSGASAGATAVQPATLNSALSNTVAESGVYDVTVNNNNAKFASLSALLSSVNLDTLIPVASRKGGMIIKFVQSSDNKYVQYFLTKNEWSASVGDWEKMNLEEEVSQLGQKVEGSESIVNGAFIGGWDITTTSYSKSTNTKRVGLGEFTMRAGDVIRLKDYTKVRMYIGWRSAAGVTGIAGWLSQDFTAGADGTYVVTLDGIPAATLSSALTLTQYFTLIPSESLIISNQNAIATIKEDIYNWYSIPEYIGSIDTEIIRTSTTNKFKLIPIKQGDTIYITFSEKAVWYAIVSNPPVAPSGKYFKLATGCSVASGTENSSAVINVTAVDAKYLLLQTGVTVNSEPVIAYPSYFAVNERVYIPFDFKRSFIKGINHRGFNTVFPENTIPAFKCSSNFGFLSVECDVRFTSDDVPVIIHDPTINRTARNSDGSSISSTINIADITYEQALTYDFGIWKGSSFAGTKIPTFEEFIVMCRSLGLKPYIELTTGTQTQIENLLSIVRQYGMQRNVTWISSYSSLLDYVKNVDKLARLGFIVNSVGSGTITTATSLLTECNEVFIDSASYSNSEIELCKNGGIPLEVWTINNATTIRNLNSYISGVTSDKMDASLLLYDVN